MLNHCFNEQGRKTALKDKKKEMKEGAKYMKRKSPLNFKGIFQYNRSNVTNCARAHHDPWSSCGVIDPLLLSSYHLLVVGGLRSRICGLAEEPVRFWRRTLLHEVSHSICEFVTKVLDLCDQENILSIKITGIRKAQSLCDTQYLYRTSIYSGTCW